MLSQGELVLKHIMIHKAGRHACGRRTPKLYHRRCRFETSLHRADTLFSLLYTTACEHYSVKIIRYQFALLRFTPDNIELPLGLVLGCYNYSVFLFLLSYYRSHLVRDH